MSVFRFVFLVFVFGVRCLVSYCFITCPVVVSLGSLHESGDARARRRSIDGDAKGGADRSAQGGRFFFTARAAVFIQFGAAGSDHRCRV